MNRTLLASVAVLALVFAGCSDDEGGTTTTTDSGSDVTTDSGTDGGTDSAVDSAPVDSATDSATDSVADSATSDSASDSAADSGLAAACTASGGTVASATCCLSTGDFPNTCATGACGCAPSSSHSVQTCNCPSSKCWNGSTCM